MPVLPLLVPQAVEVPAWLAAVAWPETAKPARQAEGRLDSRAPEAALPFAVLPACLERRALEAIAVPESRSVSAVFRQELPPGRSTRLDLLRAADQLTIPS